MDFVELTTSFPACSPKTSLMAFTSLTSPTFVDVPCALRYWMSSGAMPAWRSAMRMQRAGPSVDGVVMWKASPERP